MRVVAVTGRSGSGKSTVAAYYASLGWPVLDADKAAREVVRPGSPCLARLCAAFGADILAQDGTLLRGVLAARAFATKDGTRALTDITHPAIVGLLLAGVEKARRAGAALVFVDGAAIVGEAFERHCDVVVVVEAPEREAVARIVRRDGISEQAARARLAAQISPQALRAAADYLIENTGGVELLQREAQRVLDAIMTKETNETRKTEKT